MRAAGFENVVLLGMGGSSLCPEVLGVTFGRQPGFPALHIVDSTDPVQVQATLQEMQRLSRQVLFETLSHPRRRKRLSKKVLGLM